MLIKKLSLLAILSLTIFFTSCEDDPVTPSEEHFEAVGYTITNPEGELVFKIFEGVVDESIASSLIISLEHGDGHYEIAFLNEDGENIGIPSDDDHDHDDDDHDHELGTEEEDDDHDHDHEEGEYTLNIINSNSDIAAMGPHDWEIHITPKLVGEGQMKVEILHNDHADFTSPFIDYEVK